MHLMVALLHLIHHRCPIHVLLHGQGNSDSTLHADPDTANRSDHIMPHAQEFRIPSALQFYFSANREPDTSADIDLEANTVLRDIKQTGFGPPITHNHHNPAALAVSVILSSIEEADDFFCTLGAADRSPSETWRNGNDPSIPAERAFKEDPAFLYLKYF